MVRQDNGTQWIFYYGFNDIISYEKKPRNGNSTHHQLTINGNAVIGSHTEIAAALWQDSVGEISISLWSPLCFPKFFLLFFALSGCEEVIIYFSVNRLLMKSFLFTASLAPGLLYWHKPDTSRSCFTRNFWWQMDKRFPIQLQLEGYCKFYSRCPRHKGTLGRIRCLPQGLFQWNIEPRSIHSSF